MSAQNLVDSDFGPASNFEDCNVLSTLIVLDNAGRVCINVLVLYRVAYGLYLCALHDFNWTYGKFQVLSGNIENIQIKEKAKYPQNFFPEFKWSRKGFLRTRWNINNW